MYSINKVKMLEFSEKGDERGRLVIIEGGQDIPFEVKRVFYIYDTKRGTPRGQHANKKSEQMLICVSGSCRVKVDNGKGMQEVYELNTPEQALYTGTMLWREMYDFSGGCVLMVIASEYYNPEEYIRDYDKYIELVNGGGDIGKCIFILLLMLKVKI